jgi:hypothetical protein
MTAMITQTSDNVMKIMAWTYVGLRIMHAAVHIGPNVVLTRMFVFTFSVWTIFAMWILVVVRLPQ